jgi:8-oxo-dGTP pyrophosphatase MutT (NUDIX family)
MRIVSLEPTTEGKDTTLQTGTAVLDKMGKPKAFDRVGRKPASVVALVRFAQDGHLEVLLIVQERPAVEAVLTELVAGKDDGDGPAATAKREAEEEVGKHVEHVLQLGSSWYPAPGYSNEEVTLFVGWGLRDVDKRPEDDHIVDRWMRLGDAVDRILVGEFRDMKLGFALLMVDKRRDELVALMRATS